MSDFMGNITSMSLKRTLTDDQVSEAFNEINTRRFGGYFKITFEGCWDFYAPGMTFRDVPIDYPVWSFYRESPRRIGGKSPRPNPKWADWAWWQVLTEMTLRFGGVILDEGILESIDPKEYAGENFRRFLQRRKKDAYSHHEIQRIEEILEQKEETELQRFERVPDRLRPFALP